MVPEIVIPKFPGRWCPMQVGESVEGKDLALEEMDLLVCRGSRVAHIVFLETLCSTKMIYWTPPAGETRPWTKVGNCSTYEGYVETVQGMGYESCGLCVRSLERYGIKLS